MTTIISTPTPSTTVVSSVTVDTPHPVDSIFGRSGDVVAQDDDYNITQIDPSGASEADVIVVESGRFKIKSPVIGNEPILAASIANGDIIQFNGTNWINVSLPPVISAQIAIHAALADGVHGLTDTGGGTLFLADDGTYKALTHPPDVVTSVFGRAGVVVAAIGDYAIADITGLTTVGPPTDFLAADGIYKAIVHPPDAVTSVFGRTGLVIAVGGDYAIADITGLTTAGPGTNVLFDDGLYKPLPSERDVISPSVADATTITSAFQTIFDFSPDAAFRNNNCLITIYYQAMNIGGPATWGIHLRSLIGFTVQQNAYGAGVAQNVNSSERASFTVTMEAVVSATGNIQIQSFADVRDHDLGNSPTNGKTRLTIELV